MEKNEKKNQELQDINVLMKIHDTSKMFRDYIRRSTDKTGINSTYHRIMGAIARFGSLSQVDLVNITNLKAPTISLMLKNMEYEGLIKKEVDPQDARVVKISFTEKGVLQSEENMKFIREKELEVEKVITEEERSIILNCLEKIQNEIKNKNENI